MSASFEVPTDSETFWVKLRSWCGNSCFAANTDAFACSQRRPQLFVAIDQVLEPRKTPPQSQKCGGSPVLLLAHGCSLSLSLSAILLNSGTSSGRRSSSTVTPAASQTAVDLRRQSSPFSNFRGQALLCRRTYRKDSSRLSYHLPRR